MVAVGPDAGELVLAAAARHARDGGSVGPRDLLKVRIPGLEAALVANGSDLSAREWASRIKSPPSAEFLAMAPSAVQVAVRNALASGNYTVSVVHVGQSSSPPMSAFAPDFKKA